MRTRKISSKSSHELRHFSWERARGALEAPEIREAEKLAIFHVLRQRIAYLFACEPGFLETLFFKDVE